MTGSGSRRCEPRRDPQALASNSLTLPVTIGDIPNAARAVVAAYDGVTVQLLLDGDILAAHAWLTQLLTALLNR